MISQFVLRHLAHLAHQALNKFDDGIASSVLIHIAQRIRIGTIGSLIGCNTAGQFCQYRLKDLARTLWPVFGVEWKSAGVGECEAGGKLKLVVGSPTQGVGEDELLDLVVRHRIGSVLAVCGMWSYLQVGVESVFSKRVHGLGEKHWLRNVLGPVIPIECFTLNLSAEHSGIEWDLRRAGSDVGVTGWSLVDELHHGV